MNHRLLSVCTALLCGSPGLLAGNEQWIVSLTGSQILNGAELEIRDPLLDYVNTYPSTYEERFVYRMARVQVRLRLDGTEPQLLPDGGLSVQYDLSYRTFDVPSIATTSGTLAVDYSSSAPHTDQAIDIADDAVWAALTVSASPSLSGSFSSIPPDAHLDLVLEIERVYILDQLEYPEIIATGIEGSLNDFLQVRWNHVEGAVSYDLSYLFVDIGQAGSTDDIPFDMADATVVNTTAHAYEIPLAFPRGVIVLRARAIGREPVTGERIEGPWFGPGPTDVLDNQIYDLYRFDVNGLYTNVGVNWTHQATFAENGLRKDVLTYFDPTLKPRQSITLLNTDERMLVGNNVYDFLGRPALQLLPHPTVGPLGVKDLNFLSDLYNPLGPTVYTYRNFDTDANRLDPDPITGDFPAGEYWASGSTPIGNLGSHVPDAGGFPFSRTLYTNDGTGRVKAVFGPGYEPMTHGTGSPGHGTHYMYGKPGTQAELDRLFGNEVGDVSHYKKTVVTDPNGIVSVEYQDAAGRTIATALSGEPDGSDRFGSLEAIDTHPGSGVTVTGDLPSAMVDGAYVTNHTFPLPNASVLTFTYSLEGLSFDDCIDGACIYDLDIRILDECGELVAMQAGSLNPYHESGIPELMPALTLLTLELDPGVYTVEKTLKLNTGAQAAYVADFIANYANCYEPPAPLEQPCDCAGQCYDTYTFIDSEGDLQYINDNGDIILEADGLVLIDDCEAACTAVPEPMDPCELRLQMLIHDMSPGGQYFDNIPPGAVLAGTYDPDDYPINDWLEDASNGVLAPGMLFAGYTDWDAVRDDWDDHADAWGLIMAPFHPEYCIYQFYCEPLCTVGETPVTFYDGYYDAMMGTTHVDFDASGDLFNPLGLTQVTSTSPEEDYQLIADPADPLDLFVLGECWDQGLETGCIAVTAEDFLMHFVDLDGMGTYASIYYVLDNPDGYGPSPAYPGWTTEVQNLFDLLHYDNGGGSYGLLTSTYPPANPDQMTPWQLFRSVYSFYREYLAYALYTHADDCIPTVWHCEEAPLTSPDADGFTDGGFMIHYPANPIFENFEDFITDPGAIADFAAGLGGTSCESQCATLVASWIEQLALCLKPYGSLGYADQAALDADLELALTNFCTVDCGAEAGLSLGTVPFVLSNTGSTSLADLDATLLYFYGPDYADNCGPITTPGNTTPATVCGCDNLANYLSELEEMGLIDMSDGLSSPELEDIAEEMEDLLDLDDATVTTGMISAWLFDCQSDEPIDADTDLPTFLACMPLPPTEYDCEEAADALDEANSALLLEQALNAALEAWEANYTFNCMAGLEARETFTMNYELSEYHYTLYYYDQAGNLVKTIPPNGVIPGDLTDGVNPATTADVQEHRLDPSNPAYPFIRRVSSYTTAYTYNSWQQVRQKHTPNEGAAIPGSDERTAEYWYDPIGRLVASKNAEQLQATDLYSYSLYDELGRMTESGQFTSPDPVQEDLLFGEDVTYPNGVPDLVAAALDQSEVTHTYYSDDSDLGVAGLSTLMGALPDRQLRNRVASASYEDVYDADPTTYQHATHYAYDVHGNVKQLVQDLPELEGIAQQLKSINYSYDLISGQVKAVDYQDGEWDQFHHRYRYDADNRLLEASTSRDGLIWDRDARYFYYAHGPLARTELGEKQVQGIDHVYTVQGWLKALNSPTMLPDNDPGHDGITGTTDPDNYFAQDLTALGLGYFPTDYAPVQTVPDVLPPTSGTGLHASLQDRPLYNGNISSLLSAIPDGSGDPRTLHANLYTYDQLNRIKSSTVHEAAAHSTTLNNLASITDYATSYEFDGNGNITHLARNGYGSDMDLDDLTYAYNTIDGNDQLLQVSDAATHPNDLGDLLPGQTSTNYGHDLRGNLTKDESADIGAITWDLSGKVRRIGRDGVPPGGCTSDCYPPDLEFAYGADRQRVRKTVKDWTSGGNVKDEEDWVSTYYIRDASGNPMAIYERSFAPGASGGSFTATFALEEWPMYGSARLGSATDHDRNFVQGFTASYTNGPTNAAGQVEQVFNQGTIAYPTSGTATGAAEDPWLHTLGHKRYELNDHLGNVKATISDRRYAEGGGSFDHFAGAVASSQDYYPYGMPLPGRLANMGDHRFGFQGQEKDNELYSTEGTALSFEYRLHDPRLGRFLSIDPLAAKYSYNSPYAFSENSTIAFIELEGLEKIFAPDGRYLGQIGNSPELRVVNDEKIWNSYMAKATYRHSTLNLERDRDQYNQLKSSKSNVILNSAHLYLEGDEAQILQTWGSEYKPKSRDQEYAMMIYSHAFSNEDGTKFVGLVPGTSTTQEERDGSNPLNSSLRIGIKSIAYMGHGEVIDFFENPFDWKYYSAVHTHPNGGAQRQAFSIEDADFSLSHGIRLYMFQFQSNALYSFDPGVYNSITKKPYVQYDFPSPIGFDKDAMLDATSIHPDFFK